MQNMGVMFRIGNVHLAGVFEWLQEHPERYKKHPFGRHSLEAARACVEKGQMATFSILTDSIPRQIHFYNSPLPGVVTACCPQVKDCDGTKVEDLTLAERTLANMVGRWIEGIKNIPGFEDAYLLDCPEIGVRETRHIQGDYVLNLKDIYHQKTFGDCIGFGSHPIDTYPRPDWIDDPETAYPPRWHFQIPFRCLLARDKKNLLVAGRCLSATHEAFGCIRPTVQCMITGEAAGAAAGLCVKQQIELRELEHAELRNYLRSQRVKC